MEDIPPYVWKYKTSVKYLVKISLVFLVISFLVGACFLFLFSFSLLLNGTCS